MEIKWTGWTFLGMGIAAALIIRGVGAAVSAVIGACSNGNNSNRIEPAKVKDGFKLEIKKIEPEENKEENT